MAPTPSPWYWPKRNGWYTILDGQRYRLGDHPADAPPPQKRKGRWVAPTHVSQAFHALLAAPPEEKTTLNPDAQSLGPTVAEVLDKYLDWCQKHRSQRTYDWYRDFIQGFINTLRDPTQMAVTNLKPFHVIEWVDGHLEWCATSRRSAIIAIQRPFNWAEELGYIASNPIKRIKKPQAQRRDTPITPDDFQLLLSRFPEGDPFRDLLLFTWHSGCRPQEARHIEPRHVQLENQLIVLPTDEAKGKRRPRVIYLVGVALEIVTRLRADRAEGKLFRNAQGRPWTRYAIACRFDRLSLALGARALQEEGVEVEPLPRFNPKAFTDPAELVSARKAHQQKLRERRKQIAKLARGKGRRFAAYDLRHGFCQRMLESGANHLVVAELMGHSTGRMVAETYSHMNRATAHLKETLKKADEGAGA